MPQDPNSAPIGSTRRRQRAAGFRLTPRGWRRDRLLSASWSRRGQFVTTWSLLALIAATFIWSSTWIRPIKPVGLALIGAGYQHNLLVPHNVGAWQSLQHLAALARASDGTHHWGSSLLSLVHDPIDFYHCDEWDAGLEQASERILVVYFAVHGGADAQGPYLLPASTSLQSAPIPILRINEVLDRLARLSPDRQKILLLDCTNMRACPELGMLHNDFARGLIELNPRISEISNLVVICASGIGQRSWFCEEWRQSAFGHYLLEGFKGAAHDLDDDGRINLAELFQFVSSSVERWVQANRESSQTPVLLPADEVGLSRAGRMDLALARQDYRPPDPRDTPVFEAPRQLLVHWEAHDRLAAEAPAPWVYTPRLWRHYQDTLLRYDELLRINEISSAAMLADQLDELLLEMAQARRLPLSSLQNSLAMPTAAGWSRVLDSRIVTNGSDAPLDPTAVFNDLWRSSEPGVMPRWAAIRAKLADNIVAQQTQQYFLREQILQRAADDFAAHREKASQLLTSIDDPLCVRPAELHFLIMLNRDLPRPCSRNLSDHVRMALQVRRLAEQAALGVHTGGYPYSEEVTVWIRDMIAAADRSRRSGEDLLFAEAANWPSARREFEEAKALYQQAQHASAKLATACDVRDRLAASLPYYSSWLARRSARDVVSRDRDQALLDKIEKLWRDAHELTFRLNQPVALRPIRGQDAAEDSATATAVPLPVASELAAITACSTAAEKSFDALEVAFVESLRQLIDVDLPSVWREANDALTVPYNDSALRMKLLMNKQRMSRRRLIETSNQSGIIASTPQTVDIADLKFRAARFGRLSMAALGASWFDRCPGKDLETFEQVHHRLDLLAVENQWWKSVDLAGSQIGRRWQEMGSATHALLEKSRSEAANSAQDLLQANNLTRQLPGAAVNILSKDACQIYRHRLMANLLESQSERAWQDHWFANDPDAEPYYRRAAILYLNDAQKLGLASSSVADLRRRILGPGELEFDRPPGQQLTTEQRFSLPFCLQPAPNAVVPVGRPVAWVDVGQSLQLLEPTKGPQLLSARTLPAAAGDSKTSDRISAGRGPSFEITCNLASPWLADNERTPPSQPEIEKTSLTVHALFRGQTITRSTVVDLYAPADITYDWRPLPPRAGIAIRAPESIEAQFGDGNGSVVIVLDASGSMGVAAGQPFSQQTKYAEATHALRTVLQRLPPGAMVSLWVFGQAVGANKTVVAPEQMIRQIQAPIRWNGSAADTNSLMSRVEYPAIEPWNESPIMATLLAAKRDLQAATGFKTIVLITDGMDNRFAADKLHNPQGWDVPTALREAFDNTGIVINIIGFRLAPTEEKIARAQFQAIESLSPPGKLYTANEDKGLVAALEIGLRQRLRYWIKDYGNCLAPGIPMDGLGVSRIGANDQWAPGGLAPGGYAVDINTNRLLSMDLFLNRGDLLLAELARRDNSIQFRRVLFSAADYPWKPARIQAGWRMSALQNQLVGGQALQMLLSFEKLPDAGETALAQPRPRQIWMEVSPLEKNSPAVAVRWREQSGYPAPAWTVHADRWPLSTETALPASPRVRVWWNPDQSTPLGASLDRGPDFKNLADLAGQVITIHDETFRLESVGVEDHFVEAAPGRLQRESCLVVRVQHEPGRPAWISVDGLALQGSEHRHFTQIGKYVGFFWPVDLSQAEMSLNKLRFYSQDDFKRAAERRGYYLDADDLPPPQATDLPPRPLMNPE